MHTILLPLDGSDLALQAMPYARLLAHCLNARLVLVHVVLEQEIRSLLKQDLNMPIYAGGSHENIWQREEEIYARLRQQGEVYLQQIAATLQDEGFPVMMDVRFGAPATCILDAATTYAATLITMATHGYGGLRRWALGSVTDRVVQSTTTPVLVVRGYRHISRTLPNQPTIRRILVPLDGSPLSEQALPVAGMLAQACSAEVRLFQAVFPISSAMYPTDLFLDTPPDPADITASICRGAGQYLQHIADTLDLAGAGTVTFHATVGHPAEAILIEAEQHHADLIVMATHGYGGIQRWTLGSVADKILHATMTPVLMVRARHMQVADTGEAEAQAQPSQS